MNNTSNREHYYFIDILRAIACYLVVLHHCIIYFEQSSFVNFYIDYLKPFLLTVPLYLMISGFVHGHVIESKRQTFRIFFKDKFNRIMIPYFVVSILTIVIRFYAEQSHLISLDASQYTPFSWNNVLLRILFSGVEGHYYFLEILFLYLLLYPFLIKWIQSRLHALIIFSLILTFDFALSNYYLELKTKDWSPVNLFVSAISGFKFFFYGFILKRFYETVKPLILKHGLIWACGCLALFTVLQWNFPTNKEFWMFLPLTAYFSLALVYFNKPFTLVILISNISFGIYLLHQPYFIKFSRLALSSLSFNSNLYFIITSLSSMILTTIFVKLIDKNQTLSKYILGK